MALSSELMRDRIVVCAMLKKVFHYHKKKSLSYHLLNPSLLGTAAAQLDHDFQCIDSPCLFLLSYYCIYKRHAMPSRNIGFALNKLI